MKRILTTLAISLLAISIGCSDDDDDDFELLSASSEEISKIQEVMDAYRDACLLKCEWDRGCGFDADPEPCEEYCEPTDMAADISEALEEPEELPAQHYLDFNDCLYREILDHREDYIQNQAEKADCLDECEWEEAQKCIDAKDEARNIEVSRCYPAWDAVSDYCRKVHDRYLECGLEDELIEKEQKNPDLCAQRILTLYYFFGTCWDVETDESRSKRWTEILEEGIQQSGECFVAVDCESLREGLERQAATGQDFDPCKPEGDDLSDELETLAEGCPEGSLFSDE